NAGDHLFVVVNAGCKARDIAHMEKFLSGRCSVEELSGRALLALQGPAAGAVMESLATETAGMVFMDARAVDLLGMACFVTRSGYTGEDGFEISVPADGAEALARDLLDREDVEAIGLGARDSLRLEAGLCLYGHDIDETTTPVEAALSWAIQKARRSGGAREGGFPGAAAILGQIAAGAPRKRVGLRPSGRAPVREGAELIDMDGKPAGQVTSGGFGPTIAGPVAMGYVKAALAAPGTGLQAMVRGKPHPVTVVRLPFVESRYRR
ncbi:MAG: glycine cleavage T C-terminal barrel domain-containing protein, partial [Alphaproteobacteria bacterium]